MDPSPSGPDTGVIAAARNGAEWAWASLYRDLSTPVLRYLVARRVPDPEDVLGEAFVRVVRRIDTFEGGYADFRAWVFSIVRNLVVDGARSRTRRPEDPVAPEGLPEGESGSDPETSALNALRSAAVVEVLDALTPDQRDVILLRFFAQLTAEEVGVVLAKTTGAVKTLQQRAIAALRRELARKAVSL